EDAVLVLDRCCAAGRADQPRGQRARGAPRRRRRVRGDDLRRHHDHARAAQGALGHQDRPGRRQSRGLVLESAMLEEVLSQAFWVGLLKIIGVNIILSGDNAVVIALAARSLPARQQKQAIIWGSGGAVVMRIVLTIFAVALLKLSWLKIIGSLLLFWIGVKLLVPE